MHDPKEAFLFSELKAVADGYDNLPGFIVMRACNRAVPAEQEAAVGNVQRRRGQGDPLADRFTERHIRRRVSRQMLRSVAVQKSGAKVYIAVEPGFARQRNFAAHAERVALIVVD